MESLNQQDVRNILHHCGKQRWTVGLVVEKTLVGFDEDDEEQIAS